MTEDEMVDALTAYVKSLRLRGVATPDYRQTHFLTDQWRQSGAIRYYKLPKSAGGRVIALFHTATKAARFSVEGFEEPSLGKSTDLP